MPYVIKLTKNKGYRVYKKDGNVPMSNKYFNTYSQALAQMRAIIISEISRGKL